jgi:hypothetical protein
VAGSDGGALTSFVDLFGHLGALLHAKHGLVVLRILPKQQCRQRLLPGQEYPESIDVIRQQLVTAVGSTALCQVRGGSENKTSVLVAVPTPVLVRRRVRAFGAAKGS